VKAYRPIPKPPKDASLRPSSLSGWRMMAYVVPSQGPKRVPGPIGMEAPRPNEEA